MKTKDMVYPREILVTDFPPEIVYLSLLDHFTGRKDVKVKRYTEPSHLEIKIDKGWQRAKIDLQPQEGGTNIGLNFELSDVSIITSLEWVGGALFLIISSIFMRLSAGVLIGLILLITYPMLEIYGYDRDKEKRKKFTEEVISFLLEVKILKQTAIDSMP